MALFYLLGDGSMVSHAFCPKWGCWVYLLGEFGLLFKAQTKKHDFLFSKDKKYDPFSGNIYNLTSETPKGCMNYKYYHIPCTNFRDNISPVVTSGIGAFHCQVATTMIHGSMFHGTFNLVSRQTIVLGVE
jgi:hypothetical protein